MLEWGLALPPPYDHFPVAITVKEGVKLLKLCDIVIRHYYYYYFPILSEKIMIL